MISFPLYFPTNVHIYKIQQWERIIILNSCMWRARQAGKPNVCAKTLLQMEQSLVFLSSKPARHKPLPDWECHSSPELHSTQYLEVTHSNHSMAKTPSTKWVNLGLCRPQKYSLGFQGIRANNWCRSPRSPLCAMSLRTTLLYGV